MGWWSSPGPGRFAPIKSPSTHFREARVGPRGRSGRLWRTENLLTHNGFRAPNRPAANKSLYRLSYRGPSEELIST
jgi:hypothetical protein